MTPNGSPSWKVVAFAIAAIASLLIGSWVQSSDAATKENARDNVRQDREISANIADLNNMAEKLDRIEAKLDRLIESRR